MGLDRSAVGRVHDAMAALVERGAIPGIVTLLARGDEVVVDTIGTMNFGGAEPVRRDTIFRIASLTKPVVAATALMQVAEGLFALDEPVDRLLPELADRRVLARLDGPLEETVPAERPITVEDLLTLRLGWGHIAKPEINPPYPIVRAAYDLHLTMFEPDPRTPYGPDEWMKVFATLPLMSQPGRLWHYNVGSLVLGVLVARADGASLGEVLAERVFAPLGMDETGFHVPPAELDRLPEHYMTDQATGKMALQAVTPREAWSRPPAFPSAAGGLVSTVDDYLKFARMLLRDGETADGQRLLSKHAVAAMTTNKLTPDQIEQGGIFLNNRGWGYGVGTDYAGTPESYGWAGGSGTWWFNDRGRDLTAIAMTQVSDFLWVGAGQFNELAAQA